MDIVTSSEIKLNDPPSEIPTTEERRSDGELVIVCEEAVKGAVFQARSMSRPRESRYCVAHRDVVLNEVLWRPFI